MFHIFNCEITIRFDDDDVVEWLVCNEELDKEDAETYMPTTDDLERYAWECVENENCEYGGCYEK